MLILLLSVCKAAEYVYTREAVLELGGNCLDSSDPDASHTVISNIPNPKRSRSNTVSIDLDPGMMCWFESFNDFKIEGDSEVNT